MHLILFQSEDIRTVLMPLKSDAGFLRLMFIEKHHGVVELLVTLWVYQMVVYCLKLLIVLSEYLMLGNTFEV